MNTSADLTAPREAVELEQMENSISAPLFDPAKLGIDRRVSFTKSVFATGRGHVMSVPGHEF